MAAPATVGTNKNSEEPEILISETEPSKRVDDAIKAYFDRLVERTEVPQHLLDLISGSTSGDEDLGNGPHAA